MKLNFPSSIYIHVWLRTLSNRFIVIINKIDHSTKAENINTCTSGNPNTHFIKGGYSSAFVAVATGSPL